MKSSNRFAPPRAPLDIDGDHGAQPVRRAFPWLFVLRYLVGAYVLTVALVSLYGLSQSWARLADRSVIDPSLSPYRYLPVIFLKAATGAAILAKRRISLAFTLLWMVAFLYLLRDKLHLDNLGAEFFLNVAVLVGLFAFQCLLLTRRLLR